MSNTKTDAKNARKANWKNASREQKILTTALWVGVGVIVAGEKIQETKQNVKAKFRKND